MNKPTHRGHVRPRGNKHTASIELPRGPDGKRRTKWLGSFPTRKAAQRAVTQALRELDTGAMNDAQGVTVTAFLQRWLTDYAQARCGEKTVYTWRLVIQGYAIPRLGALPLEALTAAHLQAFEAALLTGGRRDGSGLSPVTVGNVHRLLRRALGHAVRWGLLARSPFEGVESPRAVKKHPPALTVEQAAALLVAARTHAPALYPVLLTALGTGLRRGELLGLRWEDVDLDRARLLVRQTLSQVPGKVYLGPPKSAAGLRVVPLPARVVEELHRHRDRQAEPRDRRLPGPEPACTVRGFVFARADGRAWTPAALSQAFQSFRAASGVAHTTLHALRHTYASHLLDQSVGIKTVQALCGHAGIATTLGIYGHLLGGELEEAAARMDGVLLKMGGGGG